MKHLAAHKMNGDDHMMAQAWGFSSLKAVVYLTSVELARARWDICGSSTRRTYPLGAFLSYTPGAYGWATTSYGTYGQSSAFFPVRYATRATTLEGSTYPTTVTLLAFRSTSTCFTPFIPSSARFTLRSHPSQSIRTLISTVCSEKSIKSD